MCLGAGAQASDVAFHPFDPEKAALGQLLFYDPILSGNRNISCGTCHHHDHFSADGTSLSIGEGGIGLGPKRRATTGYNRPKKRIPRHAPALWNIGAQEFTHFFHDGRVSHSDLFENGFNTPAEEWLPPGLSGLLAVQALFPMTAQFEMAGNPKENEVAGAIHDRLDNAWPILAKRVRIVPEYGVAFVRAFDDVDRPEDVTIAHIANALADFMGSEWRSLDSAYDAYLTGTPLPDSAERGRQLFFGVANCASCHSGPLFTDHGFHAIGLPPFGPGRTRRFDPMVRDVGRMAESNVLEDAYRFRTPSLRNVALTAPYGHNGAYPTLEGIVRHHLDPVAGLARWKPGLANLPNAPWLSASDFVVWQDVREMRRLRAAIDIAPVELAAADVADLVAFLSSLTGASTRHGRLGRPKRVPSGLRVD